MLTRRFQLLLDEERYERLEEEAARRGVSVAEVIRAAIDDLPRPIDQQLRREALQRILSAEPMPVPDSPEELKAEVLDAHDRFPD